MQTPEISASRNSLNWKLVVYSPLFISVLTAAWCNKIKNKNKIKINNYNIKSKDGNNSDTIEYDNSHNSRNAAANMQYMTLCVRTKIRIRKSVYEIYCVSIRYISSFCVRGQGIANFTIKIDSKTVCRTQHSRQQTCITAHNTHVNQHTSQHTTLTSTNMHHRKLYNTTTK